MSPVKKKLAVGLAAVAVAGLIVVFGGWGSSPSVPSSLNSPSFLDLAASPLAQDPADPIRQRPAFGVALAVIPPMPQQNRAVFPDLVKISPPGARPAPAVPMPACVDLSSIAAKMPSPEEEERLDAESAAPSMPAK